MMKVTLVLVTLVGLVGRGAALTEREPPGDGECRDVSLTRLTRRLLRL